MLIGLKPTPTGAEEDALTVCACVQQLIVTK